MYKSVGYRFQGVPIGSKRATSATGTNVSSDVSYTFDKTGTSDAITVARRTKVVNESAGISYQTGAHDVVGLDHYVHNGDPHPLIILAEQKLEGTGDITIAALNEAQVVDYSGTADMLVPFSASMNNCTGNLPLVVLVNPATNSNQATIGTVIGINLANMDKGTGSIGTVVGLFRPAPDGSNDAVYQLINNSDPDAIIDTLGRIVGAARQEVGSTHPGIATGRYYFPASIGAPFNSAAFPANTIYGSVFICPERTTFNRIGVKFGNAVPGATVKYYVYNMAAGVPTSLVVESVVTDASAGGDIEATISATLEAGCYFVACNTSDDTSEILFTTPQSDLLGESDSDGVDNVTVYSMASLTSAAAPATFTPGATETSITPYIWLRKV